MSETDGQEGLSPENAPEAAGATKPGTDGEIVQTAAVLDEFTDEMMPQENPLPGGEAVEDPTLLNLVPGGPESPPLETAAGAPGPIGGGSSAYQSDFGDLIGGLQASDGGTAPTGTSTPGNRFASSGPGDDDSAFLTPAGNAATGGTNPAQTPDPAPIPDPPFVPPLNPVGPGADEALFTKKADNVDLNGIDVGGYKDGTQYNAGNGNDIVVLPGSAREALEAGFAEGALFLAGRGHDQVTGGTLVDLIDGGNGHDLLIGGAGDDTLLGGRHNDTLGGGTGSDFIAGGSHNDKLTGGEGDDSLFGGSGRDTLDGGTGRDLLEGGGNNDSLTGGSGDDSLFGGNGRDTLLGGDGSDLVEGGRGNDSIDGGLGSDRLDGGIGSDLLIGGAGDDTLLGGVHNDMLIGGQGDDVMTGGSGRDVFSFSLAGNEGDDLIMDFTTTGSGRDKLEISDLIDVNSDSVIDVSDLDAGTHSVTGTADSVVITFDTGSLLTLDGVNGTGVSSFDDLLGIKVNIDIA